MRHFAHFNSQAGVTHLLLLIAALGVIGFILVTSSASFKLNPFALLFPKPSSHAAGPGIVLLDTNNQPITQTTSANIKVELDAPWPLADAGFKLIKPVYAQTTSSTVIEAETLSLSSGVQVFADANASGGAGVVFYTNGNASKQISTTGTVTQITVRARQDACGNGSARMRVYVDSSQVMTKNVSSTSWASYSGAVSITSGVYTLKVTFDNDNYRKGTCDRNLRVDNLTLTGLTTISTPTPVPTSVPTPTPVPTTVSTPTPAPTLVPTPTPTPTPTTAPRIASAIIAEDANFTQNVTNVNSFTTNPTVVNYTLSSTGNKTIYARFTSNTGSTEVYQASVNYSLVSSSPAPVGMAGESMSMQNWQPGGKNAPNPAYDKCDDGTDVSVAHKAYYVIAYDGIKYPTWHPAVVTNPITGVGKCYFGHEHGSDPQKYIHWDEIVQHFGKDQNGDGIITAMVINPTNGVITPGDRAGIPFGIANEHMDLYYNQGGVDSIFVRHEDHVGHKIEFVNKETDVNTTIDGNFTASTNEMAQIPGTNGLSVPYYNSAGSGTYQPTGVVCTHLHKFHQGTHSGDAIRNNLHEVIFHSTCQSVDVNGINAPAYYPNNTVLLTGMMAFGKPGEYVRFCFADRQTKVCADGKNPDGSCVINDPLLSKMPNAINSNSLGRNMVDKYCLQNFSTLNPGNNYFGPYEIWEGDLGIYKTNTLSDSTMIAEHGRQWDVLDPVRFVDPNSPTGFSYNSMQCAPGGAFDGIQYIGGCNSRTTNTAWDSPQSGFRGLKRTTYFGRNRVSNQGGSPIWWTDPLGGNAISGTDTIPSTFPSGLKQRISSVEADIQTVQSRIQQLYGGSNFLNDRAIQRRFNDGGGTVHAPN